ncbi:AAA family ATPase [Iodobacter sp. LRB]|uniref:AAA family ATPase n=1 Tax=unclassified Iodobacter TaxID=235634 RepID=UPI000C0EE698|nr:AAA family ATPase [Iodobacter sp. BJB302]PHV01776.1 ATP-binding protein [Iodobacter sp. BJB302]
MEILQFKLTNVGRFSNIELPLAPTDEKKSKVTVLVGNNGAGKTFLLKSLATSLSWFVARVRSEKGNGSPIQEDDIKNGQNAAAIKISLKHNAYLHRWIIAKTRTGRKNEQSSQLNDATKLAEHFRSELSKDEQTSLPLIVFYPVERVVLDIPLKIRDKHSFQQLDGYDNALNQGVDFRRFFEWFREREDAENETGIPIEAVEKLYKSFINDPKALLGLQEMHALMRDRQLSAVRAAISAFMPGFSNLRVRRKPRLYMSVDKHGESLNVGQLSQGEKSLMALVGDIARRLAMMNPSLENPLHGDGIILIDEVDLHLHPKWQRTLIARLTSTFPNCQFILTTHSPLVISDSKDVLCYLLDDGEISVVDDLYGLDANSVLLQVMDTDIRNVDVDMRLRALLNTIQDGELDKAKDLLAELSKDLPENNIELIKARLLLRKQELRHAQDR